MKKHAAALVLAATCLVGGEAAIAAPSDAIVGSWTWISADGAMDVSFLSNGTYIEGSVFNGDSAHTGIEWGTYSWNPVSGKITATSVGDKNGDWGIAGDVSGPQYVLVSGNTGNVFQPGCGDCSGTVTRSLPGASPIVGSWYASNSSMTQTLTFTADGHYFEKIIVNGSPAHTGIEFGTYSWNSATGAISATTLVDTNGNWGYQFDPNGIQYMAVNGNSALITQTDCADCTVPLTRILPVPEPETYAMFLAGLGLLGGIARRRKA